MIKIFLFAMFATIALQCKPAPGWVPPTINEQVSLSGVVFKGIVVKVSGTPYKGFVVHYNKVEYFKGCGPTKVRVTGYTSSAACGVDAPAVGSVNFVFACNGKDWALNNYTIGTGSVGLTAPIQKKIADLTNNELKCSNCCKLFYTCKTRPVLPLPVPLKSSNK